ncbi:MAG: hypothetical protein AAGF11_11975 [Myxococcota bacterium]
MPFTGPARLLARIPFVALCLCPPACATNDDSLPPTESDAFDPDDAPTAAPNAAPNAIWATHSLHATASPAAILPGFLLELSVNGSDLSVDWADLGADQYEVWRSNDPYFSPGDEGSTLLGTVGAPPLVDPAAACPSCDDAYYVVQAGSETSTTAGAHVIPVFDGYNKLPISLVNPLLDSADDLAPLAGAGLIGVHMWSAVEQGYVSWSPGEGEGFGFGLGQSPIAHLTLPPDPEIRVLTGLVPARGEMALTLVPGDNIVALPLTHPAMLASELLEAMPEASRIGRWDPQTQTLSWHQSAEHEDFMVFPGRDLHVEVTAPRPWPFALGNGLDDEFDGNLSGWEILNSDHAQIEVVDDQLHIVPTVNSPWYNDTAGPLVYKQVVGDFVATVDLTSRGVTDPVSPPPATFRVGGLMARNPQTEDENYVFVGLGADFQAEALETKTTVDSVSDFVETYWPGAEGELRICRMGTRFELLVRERGGSWQSAAVYERPDLPDQLQVGTFAFSANEDLNMQAWIDWARFEVPASEQDCSQ